MNNESEADAAKSNLETMSLGDLKKASIASAKAEKQLAAKQKKVTPKAPAAAPAAPKEEQPLPELKNPDLEAKAALVAQAEAAN